ncbi:hypothetical protein K3495_g11799 [Podosphaera aphanis]|nr:hypothetical protein K3495_g11799 [Podosphaera aphanis]
MVAPLRTSHHLTETSAALSHRRSHQKPPILPKPVPSTRASHTLRPSKETDQVRQPASVGPYPSLDMDWDTPSNSPPNEPVWSLQYDDEPQGDPFTNSPPLPINNALKECFNALETRAKEAQSLFGDISYILDNHCIPNSLPPNQAMALKNFSKDLAKVASHHFEAYMRGASAPALDIASHAESSRNKGTPPTASYANAARQGSSTRTANTQIPRNNGPTHSGSQTQPQSQPHRSDDRLFVRIPEGDKLRDLSAYAIQCHLKAKLGNDSSLLTTVQPTKSGFALCPKHGETSKLKEKIAMVGTFGDAPVENASPWTSYRIDYVPRTYGTLEKDLIYGLQPVTSAAMEEALTAAAGVAPVAITPSRENELNPSSSSTAWIVRFPESHRRLSRILYLFGCRTTTRILPRRFSVMQCTRCWLWHNARTCVSPPKCRLCGPSQHLENEHGNLCGANGQHTCPNRCIHCHGPHPADDTNCELRPTTSGPPKSKAQVSAIRHINSEARIQRQAVAGCANSLTTRLPKTQVENPDKTVASTPKESIVAATAPMASPKSIISRNSYEALVEEPQSDNNMQL